MDLPRSEWRPEPAACSGLSYGRHGGWWIGLGCPWPLAEQQASRLGFKVTHRGGGHRGGHDGEETRWAREEAKLH